MALLNRIIFRETLSSGTPPTSSDLTVGHDEAIVGGDFAIVGWEFTTGGGTGPVTDEYEVYRNPYSWTALDGQSYKLLGTTESAAILQLNNKDNREKSLVWAPMVFVENGSYHLMTNKLKSYIGKNLDLNLQDIDYFSLGWHSIFVTDVQCDLLPGGELRYSITLKYVT